MDTRGLLPCKKASSDAGKLRDMDLDYISHLMRDVLETLSPDLVETVAAKLTSVESQLEEVAEDLQYRTVATDTALKDFNDQVLKLEAEVIEKRTTRMKEEGKYSIRGLLAKMEYHFRRIDSRYLTKYKETEAAGKKMSPVKKWRTALMLYPDQLEKPLADAGFKRKEVITIVKVLYGLGDFLDGERHSLPLEGLASAATLLPSIQRFVDFLCDYLMDTADFDNAFEMDELLVCLRLEKPKTKKGAELNGHGEKENSENGKNEEDKENLDENGEKKEDEEEGEDDFWASNDEEGGGAKKKAKKDDADDAEKKSLYM